MSLLTFAINHGRYDGLPQDCGNPIANALELPQLAQLPLRLYVHIQK